MRAFDLTVLVVTLANAVVTEAKPEPAFRVQELPVREKTIKDEAAATEVKYFTVTATTPLLTALINLRVATDAGAFGIAARRPPRYRRETECTPGLTTTKIVSWICHRLTFAYADEDGDGPGGAVERYAANYFIEGNRLRALTLKDVLTPRTDLAEELVGLAEDRAHGRSILSDDWASRFLVHEGGVEFFTDEGEPLDLSWSELKPYLAHGNPVVPTEDVDGPDPEANAKARARRAAAMRAAWKGSADVRFVSTAGKGVFDRATGLEWAGEDNGADVSWDAADAYGRAYRGGGHDGWRLPTEAELEALSDAADTHKNSTDCAKGRYAVAVTPLVHLTCGLAWSSDQHDKGAAAFGFVSGNSRWVKTTDRKNYRALPVRTARKTASADGTFADP